MSAGSVVVSDQKALETNHGLPDYAIVSSFFSISGKADTVALDFEVCEGGFYLKSRDHRRRRIFCCNLREVECALNGWIAAKNL